MRMTSPRTAPTSADSLAELRPSGDFADPATTASWVRGLLDNGMLNPPLPGRGETAERFRALAQIGRVDLDLARLAEGHLDAQAILAELTDESADPSLPAAESEGVSRLWGVWAANPPTSPVIATQSPAGWRLDGTKPWCSGAGCCDAALVTAQALDGYRLFAVDLHDASARPVEDSWPARSMRGSDSRSVSFTASPAVAIGGVDAYLSRRGFWHGAVGVAATWLGGASAVADPLWEAARRRPLHPHALAHAGAIDAALAAGQTVLDEAAHGIDADPVNAAGDAELTARRVRAVIERAAVEVVDRVGRALGAAPLALDAEHAKRVGDLELYLRQSHAEHDLEALGTLVIERGSRQ
jgi:alkylation response protein AidB-like acyl-CoA dehydrogenase